MIFILVPNSSYLLSHRNFLLDRFSEMGYQVAIVSFHSKSWRPELEARNDLINRGYIVGLGAIKLFCKNIFSGSDAFLLAIGVKGILVGSWIVGLNSKITASFHFGGLGYLFTRSKVDGLRRRVMRLIFLRYVKLSRGKSIFQNPSDEKVVRRLVKSKFSSAVVPGVGVNDWSLEKENLRLRDREKVIAFIGRAVADKGINEFLACAEILKPNFSRFEFRVYGHIDFESDVTVSANLERLSRSGVIRVMGYVDDFQTHLENISIVCLPSYREGFPLALLEAIAAGCYPVVSEIAGCRALMGYEGGLFARPGSIDSLRSALERALTSNIEDFECEVAGLRLRARQNFKRSALQERLVGLILGEVEIVG